MEIPIPAFHLPKRLSNGMMVIMRHPYQKGTSVLAALFLIAVVVVVMAGAKMLRMQTGGQQASVVLAVEASSPNPPAPQARFDSRGLSTFYGDVVAGSADVSSRPPGGNSVARDAGTCPQQYICENNTLYSRDTRCVDTPVKSCPRGCSNNACVSGTAEPRAENSTAQISCQPNVVDPGMTVGIAFGCTNATGSSGTGFSTGGVLWGATSVAVPQGAGNGISKFVLSCESGAALTTASCTVEVSKPILLLTTTPQDVASGTIAHIAWVTHGMQSCDLSSPEQPDLAQKYAGSVARSGVATTSPIVLDTHVVLRCTTRGGATQEASSTLFVRS